MIKQKYLEYRKVHYTGLYSSWYAMKQRCGNQNHKQYKDYGGRGITYPKKWKSFVGFKDDMGSSFQKGLTIDRIDNDLPYSKENCRWATRKEQGNNKRSNIVIEFNGETLTLSLWAEKIGLDFGTVRSRWYRGKTIKEILNKKKSKNQYG